MADGHVEAFVSRVIRPENRFDQRAHRYLLDPDRLPADPGDAQLGPADPTQAGDPEEAVRLLWRLLELRAGAFGWEEGRLTAFGDVLPAPLDDDEFEELEQEIGVPLPDDLRALYRVADGDDSLGLLDRHPWFELAEVVELHHDREWEVPPLAAPDAAGPPFGQRREFDDRT
ncbi:SMI1/KNR4 family protein [Streptomyces odontomachi]|uniref:SMI1/KNR4 family protein n=1 Tax=Streptomyces odontomachi TaxID=2944940 RepID=UPI002109D37A|nr:SMI1/KNR4 family protein [Streptomyces sp. ODS25]